MISFVLDPGLHQATPIVSDRRPSEKNGLTFNPKKRREGSAKCDAPTGYPKHGT